MPCLRDRPAWLSQEQRGEQHRLTCLQGAQHQMAYCWERWLRVAASAVTRLLPTSLYPSSRWLLQGRGGQWPHCRCSQGAHRRWTSAHSAGSGLSSILSPHSQDTSISRCPPLQGLAVVSESHPNFKNKSISRVPGTFCQLEQHFYSVYPTRYVHASQSTHRHSCTHTLR